MSELFRKEAVLHGTRRLSGAVVLAAPLPVRVLGLFFAAIIFAGVAFASVATYARKATVTGWLVPDLGLIRATASSAGFVERVTAKEGDIVDRGTKLAELRIGSDIATGNVGETLVKELRAEADATRARARSQIERLEAESVQSTARLAKLRNELEQINIQAGLQEKRLALAREELARGEEIAAKGFMTRLEVDRRRSAALGAEQELAGQRRQIAATEREIADITARQFAITIEKETARAESATAIANLQQRITDAEARRAQIVVSPVPGRVAVVSVTQGQPVSPGAMIAIVVPQGAKLEAELLVPSRGAGFIRPGQPVHLMLQAFPHQRFGTVEGKIRSISSTVLGPSELSIPGIKIEEPIFRVRVALAREDISAYGELIPLQPGMLLSADIVFDRRSLMRWLFDPVFAVARRT
jgi:membrane fusion protein